MFNITFSKYHEELRKEAEENLRKEKEFHKREGYDYEIVLVPTGVVFNEEGHASMVMMPDVQLIRKEKK